MSTSINARRILRTPAARLATANYLALGMSLVANIQVARVLGPSQRGTLAIWIAIVVPLAVVAGLGVAALARSRQVDSQPVHTSIRYLVACLARSGAPIAVVSAAAGVAWLKSASLGGLLLLGAWSTAVASVTSASAQRGSNIRALARGRLTNSLSYAIIITLSTSQGTLTITVVAAAYCLAQACDATITYLHLRNRPATKTFSLRHLIGGVPHSGFRQRAVVAALGESLTATGDRLALGTLASRETVGTYAVAGTLAALPPVASVSFAYSKLSVVLAAPRPEEEALTQAKAIGRLAGALGLLAALATPAALWLLFGPQYSSSLIPGVILSVATVPLSMMYVISLFLSSCGYAGDAARVWWLGVGVDMILLVAMAPGFGAIGAASASLIAYTFAALLSWKMLSEHADKARLVDEPGAA